MAKTQKTKNTKKATKRVNRIGSGTPTNKERNCNKNLWVREGGKGGKNPSQNHLGGGTAGRHLTPLGDMQRKPHAPRRDQRGRLQKNG